MERSNFFLLEELNKQDVAGIETGVLTYSSAVSHLISSSAHSGINEADFLWIWVLSHCYLARCKLWWLSVLVHNTYLFPVLEVLYSVKMAAGAQTLPERMQQCFLETVSISWLTQYTETDESLNQSTRCLMEKHC